MSDQTQSSNQQVVVYALIAIAVLLAAIVGFMIYNNVQGKGASAGGSSTAASDTTGAGIAAQMPAAATAVPFDPKTATKLPAGTTPEQALKTYFESVLAGKFDVAFALLPVAQKKQYVDPTSMGQQLKQYNISGYKLGKTSVVNGDTTIVTEEETSMMNVPYTWTFKKVGGTWYIASRTSGGSLQ